MTFGEKLRKIRRENNIKQRTLANHLNIAVSTLSQYENDKRHPNFDILVAVADYFEVTTDYLLGVSTLKKNFDTSQLEMLNHYVKHASYEQLLNKIIDHLMLMKSHHDSKSLEILYLLYDAIASIGVSENHVLKDDMQGILNNHMFHKDVIDQTLNKLFRHHVKYYGSKMGKPNG